VWLDGGHNPQAAQHIADHIGRNWADGLPLVLVYASLQSKDAPGTLAPFVPLAPAVLTLPIPGHDCRDPDDLADMARALGLPATAHGHLPQALASLTAPSRVLIFGSLYLAGEALSQNGELPN
jgi:dihydrofolate synthase/folylpolyglutamate synthase